MSILIKGMTMPKNCDNCWALDDYGDYPRCRITDEQRGYNFPVREKCMDKCPLIELPPHGRLIDADELRGWYDFHSYDVDDDDFLTEEKFDKLMVATAVVRQNIDDAPTIIESEGEDG